MFGAGGSGIGGKGYERFGGYGGLGGEYGFKFQIPNFKLRVLDFVFLISHFRFSFPAFLHFVIIVL